LTTYFISDLHLHAGSVESTKLLLKFLQETGPHADAIYILGDLFAIWFGDDLNLPYSQQIVAALQNLASRNIPLYFMRGNRDFLVGKKFCAAAGCVLLQDPCVINLYNRQVLLTHGDLLCTKDLKYQKFRSFVQHPLTKAIFLGLPKFLRIKIGNWVKSKSMRNSNYAVTIRPEILDVAPDTVQAWLEEFKVPVMIHGHTHNPAIHHLYTATRIVLGDWTANSAKILAFAPHGFELQDLIATNN
jgi:UDP-2,3-diacylglucosamine hydrolase